jgi:hypothetical protein
MSGSPGTGLVKINVKKMTRETEIVIGGEDAG